MPEYFIPHDTLEILKSQAGFSKFENCNLLLTKYPRYQEKKKKEGKFEIYNGLKYKRPDLKNSAFLYHQIKKFDIVPIEFCLKPDWRLIIGLGGESVYETSITLHHIYGFPYIPGQAVKGVLRNYIINEYFSKELEKARSDKKYDLDKEIEKSYIFSYIFGKQSNKGKVVFFDALPCDVPNIKEDIMNPHYGEYYDGKKPPADHLNPVPVNFLTVVDTPFIFKIGINRKDLANFKPGESGNELKHDADKYGLVEFVKKTAIMAFSEQGIGAKTAVGYGYFNENKLPETFTELLHEIEEESKSDKERQAENQEKLLSEIEQDFSLYKFREMLSMLDSEEDVKNQDLHKQIIRTLISREKYEMLKSNNQHYELINDGFKYLKILKNSSFNDLLVKFKIGFNKIIKEFGSKKKKKEWQKIIGE